MSNMKKIVITGMGAVTPVGIGVDEYWKNITEGNNWKWINGPWPWESEDDC